MGGSSGCRAYSLGVRCNQIHPKNQRTFFILLSDVALHVDRQWVRMLPLTNKNATNAPGCEQSDTLSQHPYTE
eukprot:1377457-Karenia_brevis.AAC.1